MSSERAAASRAFEDAIARLEAALANIQVALTAPPSHEEAAHLSALEQRARGASPLLGRQRSFNAAVLSELKHHRAIQRGLIELLRSQTALVEFLRTIKPYVDTRDFADVLRAMAEEDLKRSDALLARDRRRELQLT